jgi:NTP pyrophosphatase (non-canonical NTP hydrolase)
MNPQEYAWEQRLPLTFETLEIKNFTRCEQVYHRLDNWSPTDWACAMAGEMGEACNEVKKLRRLMDDKQLWGTKEFEIQKDILIGKILDELADTVIYADLLATRLGGHIGKSIIKKFNETSDKKGTNIKL